MISRFCYYIFVLNVVVRDQRMYICIWSLDSTSAVSFTHLVITKKHVELVEVVPGCVFLFLRQIRILVFSLITKTVKTPTRRK